MSHARHIPNTTKLWIRQLYVKLREVRPFDMQKCTAWATLEATRAVIFIRSVFSGLWSASASTGIKASFNCSCGRSTVYNFSTVVKGLSVIVSVLLGLTVWLTFVRSTSLLSMPDNGQSVHATMMSLSATVDGPAAVATVVRIRGS